MTLTKQKRNSGWPELGEATKGELLFCGCRVSVWENEKVLEVAGDDGSTMR